MDPGSAAQHARCAASGERDPDPPLVRTYHPEMSRKLTADVAQSLRHPETHARTIYPCCQRATWGGKRPHSLATQCCNSHALLGWEPAWGQGPRARRNIGGKMKKTSVFLAALACAVGFSPRAHASFLGCQSIAEPMKRLACYDKAANATAPRGKTAGISPVDSAISDPVPATPIVKAVGPVQSGPRYWIEVEGGIYGFSKNLPVIAAVTAALDRANAHPNRTWIHRAGLDIDRRKPACNRRLA